MGGTPVHRASGCSIINQPFLGVPFEGFGFHEWGYPQSSSVSRWDFPWNETSIFIHFCVPPGLWKPPLMAASKFVQPDPRWEAYGPWQNSSGPHAKCGPWSVGPRGFQELLGGSGSPYTYTPFMDPRCSISSAYVCMFVVLLAPGNVRSMSSKNSRNHKQHVLMPHGSHFFLPRHWYLRQ